jgi:EAL domain-containing protein (putative c-di-GMP-specific phosphodiesterase class I)
VLSPSDFLANAEAVKAVARIEEMVFARALNDMQQWQAQGVVIPRLVFNTSSRRLAEKRLVNMICNHGLGKGRVLVGLHDPCVMSQDNEAQHTGLKALQQAGIALEITNFGTDNASITCLTQLRPERFKICNALLHDIVVSVEQRRLAGSIVGIGKALGIDVVAVGAESQEHMDVLQKLGCDVLQGFGLAEPMDAVALAAFVQQQTWRKAA